MFNLYICQLRLQLAKVHMIVTHDFIFERKKRRRKRYSSIDRLFEFHFSFHKREKYIYQIHTANNQINWLPVCSYSLTHSIVNSHFKCILSLGLLILLIKSWIIIIRSLQITNVYLMNHSVETWWSFVKNHLILWQMDANSMKCNDLATQWRNGNWIW